MSVSKRLLKEYTFLHQRGYHVTFPISRETKNIYLLILFGNKDRNSILSKISVEIIREYLFPLLVIEQNIFWVNLTIDEINYKLNFSIPKNFPFVPPTIMINNTSLYRIKQIGNYEIDHHEKFNKLCSIYDYIYLNYSPMTKIYDIIENIIEAVEIHHSFDFLTDFQKYINSLNS